MKKMIAFLLLLCLLPLGAFAETAETGSVTVTLDDMELTFAPIEGYCLTRESSASVFNQVGMSQRDVVPWMEEYDVYVLLYDETLNTEIQIAATPTTDVDFSEMSEEELAVLCESLYATYIDQGYAAELPELYQTPEGYRYVHVLSFYTYEDGYVEEVAEYFTCEAGYVLMVVLFSYEGTLTEEQIALCSGVVDSLRLMECAAE